MDTLATGRAIAPRPSTEEEEQIPPDETPREARGRRDSRTSSGARLSVPDETRGSGEMFSATVPALKTSHDPSVSVGPAKLSGMLKTQMTGKKHARIGC